MLKIKNDKQIIPVNAAQRLDVGNGPTVIPPLVPYVPPPVTGTYLLWGAGNNLLWGAGNKLKWG